jgi:(2Fe-2S) ferredoxin
LPEHNWLFFVLPDLSLPFLASNCKAVSELSFSSWRQGAPPLCGEPWPLTSGSPYSSLTSLQRKRYLFVCINRRAEDNPKGCCAAKDSEEVYRALKGEVAARGLAKLEARVCTSSCLDQCETGVTVLVEPDHFFYGRVTVADVLEIVDGLVKGQPVTRLVITADQHR